MGAMHMCAVSIYKQFLHCWGNNQFGNTIVPRHFRYGVEAVGAGLAHTCALRIDHIFTCWGLDGVQVKGINYNISKNLLDSVQTDVIAFIVGSYHNCVVKLRKTNIPAEYQSDPPQPHPTCYLVCWGSNEFGQIDLPALFSGDIEFTRLVDMGAGYRHTCGLAGETIMCWGDDEYGQATPPYSGGFRRLLWSSVGAGFFHNCGYTAGGLVCWGNNRWGQTTVLWTTVEPLGWAVGGNHNCMVSATDKVSCWGSNEYGQSSVPVIRTT